MSEFRSPDMLRTYYMEASEDNDAPDDKETPTEEKDATKKEDNASTPEETTSDNVGDDDELDLSNFGNNGGDDLPNNEYDTSEVETLNKLIASEASAISEYAEAAKTSHEDILQRLYSDISDEERFHLEQLMFAKAELTGEKYMPTDPAVKKEYEELLELGMDEESAMATAVDKTGLRKQIEESDGDIEADTKQLETEIEMLEAAVFNTELLMTIMEQAEERRDQNLLNQIYVFSESYYQEAVMNSADASDEIRKPFNPFHALWKLLMGIMRGIATLIANFKKWIVSVRQRRAALQQWIQNHGIQGLFDSGVWLYLWNDQTQSFDFNDMALYIDALYVIAADCAKDGFGVNGRMIDQDAFNKYASAFQSSIVPLGVNGQIPNREGALNRIQSLNMVKTKIIVNQQNENIIREMWFGYTDDAMIKFNPENKPVTLRSKNIYNAIQYLLDVSNYYGLRTGDLIKGFQTIGEGSPNRNSIFYTNRNLYNEDYRQLKIVVKGYSTLSKCFTHDLKTIMWVNNGVLERTNAKDAQNNDTAHRYADPNQTRMFVNNKSQQELDAEKYSRDQWYKNHQTAVQNGNTTPPPPQVAVNK